MTVRTTTFSQAPRAVRSARGRGWDLALSTGAPTYGAFQADKRNAFGLTVQVHRLRDISSTATIRAVVRTHTDPPSVLTAFS